MNFLIRIIGTIVAFFAAIFAAKGWGKEKAKRQMHEQQERAVRDAKKLEEDLERRTPKSKRDELLRDFSKPE